MKPVLFKVSAIVYTFAVSEKQAEFKVSSALKNKVTKFSKVTNALKLVKVK